MRTGAQGSCRPGTFRMLVRCGSCSERQLIPNELALGATKRPLGSSAALRSYAIVPQTVRDVVRFDRSAILCGNLSSVKLCAFDKSWRRSR